MTKARKELGSRGESLALAYFKGKGYQILDKNYRKRSGEIDLILKDGHTLVFCEVKTSRLSGAAERYSPRQQQRMKVLALSYIGRINWSGAVRFDLITLEQISNSDAFQPNHLENVLNFDDRYL